MRLLVITFVAAAALLGGCKSDPTRACERLDECGFLDEPVGLCENLYENSEADQKACANCYEENTCSDVADMACDHLCRDARDRIGY